MLSQPGAPPASRPAGVEACGRPPGLRVSQLGREQLWFGMASSPGVRQVPDKCPWKSRCEPQVQPHIRSHSSRTGNPRCLRLRRAFGIQLRSHGLAGALARSSRTASLLLLRWDLRGGGRAASPGSEARLAKTLLPTKVLPQSPGACCPLCLRHGPSLLLLQVSAQRSPPHRSPPGFPTGPLCGTHHPVNFCPPALFALGNSSPHLFTL